MSDRPFLVPYVENAKQRLYVEAVFSGKYRFLYYGGAIRGGKSFCVMALIFLLCRIFPGSRWVIVRKTLPDIKRTLIPVFNALRPVGFCGPVNRTDWVAECTNGSMIIFFAESLQEDPQYNRWRGIECNGFWLEEANELAEGTWNKAIERSGSWVIKPTPSNPSPDQPLPYIFLTSNPAANWVKRIFYTPWKLKTLKAPYFYVPATIRDNPHLPAAYLQSLENLPERDYKVFVEGDWDALSGTALEELDPRIHIVPAIKLPPHWFTYGAFDWGYAHPFSFGLYATNAEGFQYKVETITGRKMDDRTMIQYILERSKAVGLEATALNYVVAGLDAFHDVQARAAVGPTTAERFNVARIPMIPADPSRISGLKNLREALAWKRKGPGGTPATPTLRFFDTPANRRAIEQMQNLVLDPDRPEDVLKLDANENGEGGDDIYDETRYAAQSRAQAAPEPPAEPPEDVHPGFDLKMKKRRPSRNVIVPDDTSQANRYGVPAAPSTRFRMPNPFSEQDFPDENED